MPRHDDEDLKVALQWFMNFIPSNHWRKRKEAIEKRIEMRFRETPLFSEPISEGTALVVNDDQIGWYLFLIDSLLYEPQKYEFYQGARVLPLFKRIGADINLLKQIEGINSKVRKLLMSRTSEADAILFEILTALLWKRNGWQVKFIKEGKGGKTPDFIACNGGTEWYIECKRQSKTSDYAVKERAKWQVMISHISRLLVEHNILLNVVFHVELKLLSDTFLKDILSSKIPLIVQPGKVVSNALVDIDVSFVNIRAIKDHLKKYLVKNASPQIAALIGNKALDNWGFTSGMKAAFFKIGTGSVNNLYINDIEKAYGAFWRCDAREAIVAKARDIKKQIFAALQQFQPEQNAVIHIGMETFDGPSVEQERALKISDTLDKIELNGKSLKWAFCHFFQSYSPVETVWAFDETVNAISSNPPEGLPPLRSKFLIVPEDEGIDILAHWERPLP